MRQDDMGKRNPVKSSKQWGLMQAARSGASYAKRISDVVAEEMIHRTPKNKRSKFAKELAKRRKKGNPSEESLEGAKRVSEEWHGRKAKEVVDVTETERYNETAAYLADLEELGILGKDNYTQFQIAFKKNRPKLVADVEKENLEIVGGDQKLEFDEEFANGKNLIPVGYCYCIVYETDKHHLEGSNGYPESYEHFFGEEYYKEEGFNQDDYESSQDFFNVLLEEGVVADAIEDGYLPILVYDVMNEKLSLVGGRYKIEDVGIVD